MPMSDNLTIAPVQRGLATKNSEHTRHWWSATIHATRPIEDTYGDKFFPDRASCDWWTGTPPTWICVEGAKMKKDGTAGKMRTRVYYHFKPKKSSGERPLPDWLQQLFEARKHDPSDEDRDPVKPTVY